MIKRHQMLLLILLTSSLSIASGVLLSTIEKTLATVNQNMTRLSGTNNNSPFKGLLSTNLLSEQHSSEKNTNHHVMASTNDLIHPRVTIDSDSRWQLWYYFQDADADGMNDTFQLWYLLIGNDTSDTAVKHEWKFWYKNETTNDSWTEIELPVLTTYRHHSSFALSNARIHFPWKGWYVVTVTVHLPTTNNTNPPRIVLNATFVDAFNGTLWTSVHGLRDGDFDGKLDTLSLSYVPEWTFPDDAVLEFEVHVNVWFWDEDWHRWNLIERSYQNMSFDEGKEHVIPHEIIYNSPKNGTIALEVLGFGNDTFLFRELTFWMNISRFQGRWEERHELIDDNDDSIPDSMNYSLILVLEDNKSISLITYFSSYWFNSQTGKWSPLDSVSELWFASDGKGEWHHQWQIPARKRFRLDIRVAHLSGGLIFSRSSWINIEKPDMPSGETVTRTTTSRLNETKNTNVPSSGPKMTNQSISQSKLINPLATVLEMNGIASDELLVQWMGFLSLIISSYIIRKIVRLRRKK